MGGSESKISDLEQGNSRNISKTEGKYNKSRKVALSAAKVSIGVATGYSIRYIQEYISSNNKNTVSTNYTNCYSIDDSATTNGWGGFEPR